MTTFVTPLETDPVAVAISPVVGPVTAGAEEGDDEPGVHLESEADDGG